MTRPGRYAAALTVALTTVVSLGTVAGCSSTSSSPGSGSGSGSGATPAVIDVTFAGRTVTPNGERVKVPVGQDVTLDVTADAAGEIHVHSTPEQELDYAAGRTTLTIKDLDQPGIVEVESHALDKVILQLQVQ